MNAHASPSSTVVRFPPRLRVAPSGQIGHTVLDGLLSAGIVDDRQHAAAMAYRTLRQQFESATRSYRHRPGGASMPGTVFLALKRDHAALLRVVGAERWPLDRLCLDDEAPMRCEVERVMEALDRLAHLAP